MLKMTDEQRYDAVLKELGEVLQCKNTTIRCQSWQIDNLKEALAAAEKERDEARSNVIGVGTEVRKVGNEMVLVLNNDAVVALRAINAELREICIEYGCSSCASELKALQKAIASVLPIEGGAA